MKLHTTEIDNSQDFIDSRDIIGRIEYLEIDIDELDDDEKQELETLKDLESQCQCGDWEYGATLINDDYFVEYAQDLAEDIGAIDRNANWPCNHIDWNAAADELKTDYFCVDFDGEEYWLRG